MLKKHFVLNLHDEGSVEVGGTETTPANSSPAPEVVLGRPGPATEPVSAPAAEPAPAPVDRTAEYAKFKETYKDLYGNDIKSQIDRRLSGTKKAMAEMQSTLDIARQFFGLDTLEELAEFAKTGLTSQVPGGYKPTTFADPDEGGQAPEVNLAPADLATQAVALKERYPDFDLETQAEALDPLLKRGLSLEQAYVAQNFQQILQKETLKAAESQKRATIEAIRTRGIDKVDESVSKPAPAVVHKTDPSTWSKEEMAEARKRAMRGDPIYL